MRDKKWTPGPWRFDVDNQRIVGERERFGCTCIENVAKIMVNVSDSEVANRLLITAAPELYEALFDLKLLIDTCEAILPGAGAWIQKQDSYKRAKAAMAKARGEGAA